MVSRIEGRVPQASPFPTSEAPRFWGMDIQVGRDVKTANKPLMSIDFNFKEWAELAQSDPDRFEARRSRVINEAIRRVPADRQRMLRGLQWRVDRVRELKRTPLAACMAISDMMWETFSDLHQSYAKLAEIKPGRKSGVETLPTASIIRFPERKIEGRDQ